MEQKPKIVVLDAVALRDADMDWSGLYDISDDVAIYPHTLTEELVERIGNADAVVINKGVIDRKVLEHCKQLKYVGITATGFDTLNIKDCESYGVTVANVPNYSSESVAQQLFALLLEYANHTSGYAKAARNGEWLARMKSTDSLRRMVELNGKTIGILGYGNIGSAVARIAAAFGMRVLCYSFSNKKAQGVEFCSLDRLVAESDILSLHCRHTEDTDKIINADRLNSMKQGAVLCNVSRGRLIDDDAVYNALKSGKLSFYIADVLTGEPMTQGNKLLGCENVVITPHVAWATDASLKRLSDIVVQNMRAYFDGCPVNVVNNPKV